MKSDKMKKISDILILVLFIISVFFLIKYSEMPNYFNIKLLEKPENVSNIYLSIFTGYVVSAIFYCIVNYIPDMVKKKEDSENELPARIARYRDIQLFVSKQIFLWKSIAGDSEIHSIEELFDKKRITASVKAIELSKDSGVMIVDMTRYLTWEEHIFSSLSELYHIGKDILIIHRGFIPEQIQFSIHYLIYECNMCGELLKNYKTIHSCMANKVKLYSIISKRDNEIDTSKMEQCMKTLYKWGQNEYKYIVKNNGKVLSDIICEMKV